MDAFLRSQHWEIIPPFNYFQLPNVHMYIF